MPNFTSPGSAMVRALEQFLIRQAAEKCQAMLDDLAREDRQIDLADRQRQIAEQRRQADRQARLDQQADADRLARIHGPDVDLSDTTADALRKGGYQVNTRNTLAARTLSLPADTAPGVVAGGKAPMVPGVVLPSVGYKRRNETYVEQQAREQREAGAAERDEARRFR